MTSCLAPLVSCVLLSAATPSPAAPGQSVASVLAEPEKPKQPAEKPAAKSVEERVRAIIVEQLGVKPEQVTLKARLREDLTADSLDMVELVLTFEEEFSISIPDAEAAKLSTVGDVVTCVKKHMKKP